MFIAAVHKGAVKPTPKTLPRFEELGEHIVLAQAGEIKARKTATPKTPAARSRKASVASAAATPTPSPKSRPSGVRKASAPRKTAAIPRKISAVQEALKNVAVKDASPPKIDALIDPLLLKQSEKEDKAAANSQDALKKYDALKMPTAKVSSAAVAETIASYNKRLMEYSAKNNKLSSVAENSNVVADSAALMQAPVPNMVSHVPAAASSANTGFSGDGSNKVTSANATLAATPIKCSPVSNTSAETSPVDGADAAKLRNQNFEPDTPTKLITKPKAAADAILDNDWLLAEDPFMDNSLLYGMDLSSFEAFPTMDGGSVNDWCFGGTRQFDNNAATGQVRTFGVPYNDSWSSSNTSNDDGQNVFTDVAANDELENPNDLFARLARELGYN